MKNIENNFGSVIIGADGDKTNKTGSTLDYVPILSNLVGIEKFNNIYVQYENNNGIALYFNYGNYYESPFVSLKDGR
jgi:hypothetical protein